MGSDRVGAGAGAAGALAVAACVVTAQPAAAAQWWAPLALQGTALSGVVASGATVTVRSVAGATLRSSDGGRTFTEVSGDPPLVPPAVTSGGDAWAIDAGGRVLHSRAPAQPLLPDPGAPGLGAGAHLLTAPAALPGVVVAVATDGTVWRRGADGGWSRALLLLPQSALQGVPRITAVTSFTQPLSDTVYLGTDGYAVLNSTDGGDDWIRAGPGLPDSVTGLAADSATHSVYAATADGLWVHQLQALPSPPAYRDAELVWRWVGIGLVTATASLLTVVALLGVLRTAPSRARDP